MNKSIDAHLEVAAALKEYRAFEKELKLALIKEFVDEFPNDVQEVKHGRNITEENPVDAFICSECGFETIDISRYDREDDICYEYELRYCPNCGAKMDGGLKND